MLTLTGIIRAATQLGGGVKRSTGEIIPLRSVVQVEGLDSRGLVQIFTLTVPDLVEYQGKVGEKITVPVRAWASAGPVNLSYEASV